MTHTTEESLEAIAKGMEEIIEVLERIEDILESKLGVSTP